MFSRRGLLGAVATLTLTAMAPHVALAQVAKGLNVGLPTAKPESVGFSTERLGKLDATFDAMVDSGKLPGVITVLARHGKVVSVNIHGKVDTVSGAPATNASIWRMYSQTKPVTGVAMMILYEEGRWKLDDPVTKYVPEFKGLQVFKGMGADGKPILEPISRSATMRELMTHTAGFAYGLIADNYVDKLYQESLTFGSPTLGAAMGEVSKLPLASQPGEQWKYSVAVDIQGYIVEKLSGQSLPDFMQSRIFGPLKMPDTAFWVPEGKRSRLATLYAFNPKTGQLVPAEGFMVLPVDKVPTAPNGGGGLVSTLPDFTRFAQMLGNGGELDGVRILSPGTIKLMASNHLTDKTLATYQAWAPGHGFGLDVDVVMDPVKAGTLAGKGTYSWGGAAGTWFWVDPENDVVFLGFIQILGGSSIRLDDLSQALVYQALVDPAK